jgi:hypothetical protein
MGAWWGGHEPSLLDATGTSAATKTSRPWRSVKEEGPGAMVWCPWHHGATTMTSRPWRSAEEEAPDVMVSVVA